MNTETKILFDNFYKNISFCDVKLCEATKDYLTILEKDLDDYADNIIAVTDNEAYDRGYMEGRDVGEDYHYDEGHDDGTIEGHAKGKEEGIDEGKLEGYDDGYDIGFADGESGAYDLAYVDALTHYKKDCKCSQ